MPRTKSAFRLMLRILLVAALSRAQLSVAAVPPPVQASLKKSAEIDAVKSIIDGMQGAEARLKQGDAGPDTRQIQEKVVNDIQKLIDAAKAKSSNSNPQQNSGSRQQSGSQSQQSSSQPQSQQSKGENPGAKPAGTGKPGRKSGAGRPLPSEKKGSAPQQRPLFREVWGHLPPALRERAPADFHETVLPAYDDLVRRYFEALLDGTSSAPNRPVAGQASPGQTSLPERSPELPAQ